MIGLEIHCQLTGLNSKLFCPCRADYRGMEPNTNVCPVCMGLPGTLPLLNAAAVRSAAAIAMSLNCVPGERLAFFRKNYFYPDLPKNFQITQYDAYGHTSVGGRGVVRLGSRDIRITRVQLEEDPGRLSYEGGADGRATTLVDYNRAGVALVEVVTEPDFEDPRQARDFMNMLADTVESLGAADPHLDGAMRADGNVSVRGGNKVEIKNINSFHDLERALHFELTRQNSLCDAGRTIVQETRHWDERRRITVPSRTKEAELDYRYFLEGDIPWVAMDSDTVRQIREAMPESVMSRRERYIQIRDCPPGGRRAGRRRPLLPAVRGVAHRQDGQAYRQPHHDRLYGGDGHAREEGRLAPAGRTPVGAGRGHRRWRHNPLPGEDDTGQAGPGRRGRGGPDPGGRRVR